MVGWHHQLDGHEFEQTPGDGEGQGSQACCSPWGHKESDTTERLNDSYGLKYMSFPATSLGPIEVSLVPSPVPTTLSPSPVCGGGFSGHPLGCCVLAQTCSCITLISALSSCGRLPCDSVWLCLCTNFPFLLGPKSLYVRPSLIQDDLVLTNNICKDCISKKGHRLRFSVDMN